MAADHEFRTLLDRMKLYTALSERYLAEGVLLARDEADKENPGTVPSADDHYMAVGYSAMRIVTSALVTNNRDVPRSILDFPSGSGRITRHFRAMFPDARIGACDLYEAHTDFCARHFGAEPIASKENLDELDVGSDWDLVFCGSLLTHLPETLFWPTIDFITRSLSERGLAIVTLEGRHAEWRQDNSWKFMSDRLFAPARAGFNDCGFGFADYEPNFKSLFDKQARYGIALAKPSWVLRGLEQMENITILGYVEHAWDRHQDVVIFGKPGVNDGAPTPANP
ncbi:MAG TPA: class I SAM-dependent methyltransferase [Pseudorhizobium sp.]|jgi:hypothetical protein|nr:class I SAM-dependent methyltransferase [Pseudorhizobium sp.]